MTNKSVARRSGSKTFLTNYVEKAGLETGVYKIVPESPSAPTHLDDFTPFTLPSKIYGEELEYLTSKVLNTFNVMGKSVGVLLSGLKGTGKSLQLKHLAMNSNMPVLIVDTFIDGTELINFLETVPTSCMVLFDEFEKTYEGENQLSVLPILDGLSSTPHIYVLTVNGNVSEFLLGRPSRIRYAKYYSGLGDDLIREITEDLLVDKSKSTDVADFLSMLVDVNMDTVVSFIQDVNMYGNEEVLDLAKTFNVENPYDGDFNIIINTPGLMIKGTAGPDIDIKVSNFMLSEFGKKRFSLNTQIAKPDIVEKNLEQMKIIADKFPNEVYVGEIFGKIESYELFRTIQSMSNSTEDLYIHKHYGSFDSDSCPMEQLHSNYFLPVGEIEMKKGVKGSLDLYANGVKFAKAERIPTYTNQRVSF